MDITVTDEDLMKVIDQQQREITTLRIKLVSAVRTLQELDLDDPDNQTKLLGILTERGENDELSDLSDESGNGSGHRGDDRVRHGNGKRKRDS